ncbi:MAG: ABC transporter substrate-binding protein [Phycisphaeraceae bacterium]|nr:ABC transporter substrate-binding protein [Phycisphaeraceae bacterium]
MRRPAQRLAAALALLLALLGGLVTACGGPGSSSDAEANASTSTPRIVVLSPGIGETLDALGLGEFVVGRHAFDRNRPDDIPVVGDQNGIDYERLLRLEPTHVLLERSASGAPPRLDGFAGSKGFVVREIPMLTLDDIRGCIGFLTTLFRVEGVNERASELLAALDEALSPLEQIDDRAGRMLLLYWTDPIGVAGPGSYHAEIVRSLGAMLAVDTGRAYQELDAEDTRRLYPDSIALFIPGADPSRKAELLGILASLDLRAVNSGRVAIVNHPSAQVPGPAVIDVANQLREAISSWPFLADVP